MQEEHPQIELYVNVGSDEENAAIEQLLASLQVDLVVKNTLLTVGVQEPTMLTLLITNDEAIRDMNKQYRQHDTATDVLSFPLLDKPLVHAPADQLWQGPTEDETTVQDNSAPAFVTPPELLMNLGDIVISWPTVQRQAVQAGHSPTYELLYLIAHGLLHLVGYDDQNETGYQAMVRMQRSVLHTIGQKTSQS